jgi:hypothetical protein
VGFKKTCPRFSRSYRTSRRCGLPIAHISMAFGLCLVSISMVLGVSASNAQASDFSAWPSWGHFPSLAPSQAHPEPDHRVGNQAHIAGTAETAESTNWSGLVDTGPQFTAVASTWTVPTVQTSEGTDVSSTWIGIDGYSSSTIIQTGTAQNTEGGTTSYFAWYELYPSAPEVVGDVSPGDEMLDSISEDSPGVWTISIDDVTSGESTSGEVSYDGAGSSAEFIEEDQGTGNTLADFGTAEFNNPEIGVGTSSPVDPIPVDMIDDVGNVIAYPSNFTSNSFMITYGSPPATATQVSANPTSITDGGSVTYSAVVSSGGGVPTGTVAFSEDSTFLCTATLSEGEGSCSSASAQVGGDTVEGSYSGDFDFAASSGTTGLSVSAPPTPPAPSPAPPASPHGYWLVGSDGGIFSFGSAIFHGSTGDLALQRPVVGIVPTKDDGGYWLDASDGGVFSFGDTQFYGSIPGIGLNPAGSGLPHSLDAPIVGMVPSNDDGGYFMVASDGGVFAFGDARFAGSCPGIGGCSGPAVAVMPDASGNGYWLVTKTGSVYTFGDASYYGAPGNVGSPITSAVRTPDGDGYWILTASGTIYPYGNAGNYGEATNAFGGLNPATAIFTTSDGGGYWVASADGTVLHFGDAPSDGDMAGTQLNGSIIAATGF